MTENEALKLGKALYDNITSNANNIIPTKEYTEFVGMAIQALEKVQQFESIGTIEEFKALKERDVPKKPIRIDECTCPSCGTHNEIIKKRRNTVAFDTVYCWHCGQAIEVKRY